MVASRNKIGEIYYCYSLINEIMLKMVTKFVTVQPLRHKGTKKGYES